MSTKVLIEFAIDWWEWMTAGFWQFAVLFVIVFVIDRFARRCVWPQLMLALWVLVMVKLLIPPTLYSPLSVTSPLFAGNGMPRGWSDELPSLVTHSASNDATMLVNNAATASTGQPILLCAVFVTWLAGTGFLVFLYIRRSFRLRATYSAEHELWEVPAWLAEMMRDAGRRIGLWRTPQLIITERIDCPAVFGLFNTCLLVPRKTLATMSREDLRNILLHELSHIKRGDLWLQSLTIWIQIVHWFNPLVWVTRKRVAAMQEICCDATVAANLQGEASGYRRTLLSAARYLTARPISLHEQQLGLIERAQNIIERLRFLEWNWARGGLVRAAGVTLCMGFMLTFVMPMGIPRWKSVCSEFDWPQPGEIRTANSGDVSLASKKRPCVGSCYDETSNSKEPGKKPTLLGRELFPIK